MKETCPRTWEYPLDALLSVAICAEMYSHLLFLYLLILCPFQVSVVGFLLSLCGVKRLGSEVDCLNLKLSPSLSSCMILGTLLNLQRIFPFIKWKES